MATDPRSFEEVVRENQSLKLQLAVAQGHQTAILQALTVIWGETSKSTIDLVIRTAAALLSRGI